MEKLKQQFLEVSDALALGNPAIIEKDYWVVALLAELAKVNPEHHQMVFSGGTALTKSNVKILRMSEDVDIKLIPQEAFDGLSRAKKKAARKTCINEIEHVITQSERFKVEERIVCDEYRYVELELRYPQQFSQAPCLRPIIKLELMETIPLLDVEPRPIQSLVAELFQQPKEVKAFDCVSIQATLVEKVISMLRRTMSVKRNEQRKDDATLVRHIYDVYCILKTEEQEVNLDQKALTALFKTILEEDVERFGNQHEEFAVNPKLELQLGLQELEENPVFRQRFQDFVTPMVFNSDPHDFDLCFVSFKRLAESLITTI
ncbi:nucleotidyl transferase AbiEii/AbiGii toxin family protein [Vibrio neptunius]|uniref:Nucleotidyl transferase AbiEii/AbiGii toxin family protein n=1 Tax=Vibrio neptunius TaxID=170651 RepID=A0ABS3A7S3_9VIBR|nr:nucleotidyl transferase AbiEii/AbiGii toxin family protein [Vibrio neptunius]MBN3495682.1 nucleotidyl transferase AbiEii/AbiGii toxin family protein [Vibrio neptunius]MBN3517518.1 nucleotidyl transferase AbiEii/AbiGii toxin family protein [Vibrio neptunius]MBN3551855.1 nucleotidyl transferase AbiEii/AbiGii toxin family protein [Vibrio neptunius]MBN3580521.1 nucleotidyl transferase AbiEii/AbiGii toxin family protein [Vibrio neptunius]MCH9874188.1 nucleotidyl transferase AbiEii/AbiGii toxin f